MIHRFSVVLLVMILSTCAYRSPPPEIDSNALTQYFESWQGTPYRLGGQTLRGLDCSAFVQNTYREVYHLQLPRDTKQQAKMGKRIRKNSLQRGDLVFFKTGWFLRHVGIYTQNGKFIHASTRRGVVESSLNEAYWKQHYWKSRRIY